MATSTGFDDDEDLFPEDRWGKKQDETENQGSGSDDEEWETDTENPNEEMLQYLDTLVGAIIEGFVEQKDGLFTPQGMLFNTRIAKDEPEAEVKRAAEKMKQSFQSGHKGEDEMPAPRKEAIEMIIQYYMMTRDLIVTSFPKATVCEAKKFFIVSLMSGVDRALQSYQRNDSLWQYGSASDEDRKCNLIYDPESVNKSLGRRLMNARRFHFEFIYRRFNKGIDDMLRKEIEKKKDKIKRREEREKERTIRKEREQAWEFLKISNPRKEKSFFEKKQSKPVVPQPGTKTLQKQAQQESQTTCDSHEERMATEKGNWDEGWDDFDPFARPQGSTLQTQVQNPAQTSHQTVHLLPKSILKPVSEHCVDFGKETTNQPLSILDTATPLGKLPMPFRPQPQSQEGAVQYVQIRHEPAYKQQMLQAQTQQTPYPSVAAASTTSTQRTSVKYAKRFDPYTGEVVYMGLEPEDASTQNWTQDVHTDPRYDPQGCLISQGKDDRMLPKAGVVLDQNYEYERKIRKPAPQPFTSPLDAGMRVLDQWGVPANSTAAALTMASTAAQVEGMTNMIKNKREQGRYIFVKEPTLPPQQDLSIDSFDYNINGLDGYSILGERFLNTRFASETARMVTMRGIFQRVVDDPRTPLLTKEVTLNLLGQFDLPKIHKEDTQNSALEAARMITKTSTAKKANTYGNLIPPPVLGTNSNLNPELLKNLYLILGMDIKEKFTVGSSTCKPLRFFLPALADTITGQGLTRQGAYALLLSILTGDSYEQVRCAAYDDPIPFEQTWMTLQKTSSRPMSTQDLQLQLNHQFEKRPEDLEGTLVKIQNIRAKMFDDMEDPAQKKIFITKLTTGDFLNLIHQYYPSQAGRIQGAFEAEKNAQELERSIRESQGRLHTFEPKNEINMLRETICSVLSKPGGITEGPCQLIGSSSVSAPKTKKSADASAISVSAIQLTAADRPAEASQEKDSSQQFAQGVGRGSNKSRAWSQGNRGRGRGLPFNAVSLFANNQNGFTGQQAIGINPQQAVSAVQMVPVQQVQQAQPTQQQQQQFHQGGGQRRPPVRNEMAETIFENTNFTRGNCFLCNTAGHGFRQCALYPNLYPVEKECPTCGGLHPVPCRQGQQPPAQNVYPVQQQQAPFQNQGQGQPMQIDPNVFQPQGTRYQNPNPNRGFNRGFGRGFGNGFGRGGGGFGRGSNRFRNTNFGGNQTDQMNVSQILGLLQSQGMAASQQQQPQQSQNTWAQPQQAMTNPVQQQAQPPQNLPQQQVQQQALGGARNGLLGNGGVQAAPDTVFLSALAAQQIPQGMQIIQQPQIYQ
jgi:hypothetical protein